MPQELARGGSLCGRGAPVAQIHARWELHVSGDLLPGAPREARLIGPGGRGNPHLTPQSFLVRAQTARRYDLERGHGPPAYQRAAAAAQAESADLIRRRAGRAEGYAPPAASL